ncbi:MAG: DUF1326 domain-containing protein [Acidobacteria bacterium]|nr:DUF1326 domain-containing protein [Acidobacteriota bacterium]
METKVNWTMKGRYTKRCNCQLGCPCDFWDRPSKGHCEGMLGMIIDEGHYGGASLGGIKFAATYFFPGALHEGNGRVQIYIDERANEAQRGALLTILSGKAGGPWFEVVASLMTTIYEPLFVPIEMDLDVEGLNGTVRIPGHLETIVEPIKNIATGGAHRIQVVLPEGMEYKVTETARTAVNKAQGNIAYDAGGLHSSLARVTHTPAGVS